MSLKSTFFSLKKMVQFAQIEGVVVVIWTKSKRTAIFFVEPSLIAEQTIKLRRKVSRLSDLSTRGEEDKF